MEHEFQFHVHFHVLNSLSFKTEYEVQFCVLVNNFKYQYTWFLSSESIILYKLQVNTIFIFLIFGYLMNSHYSLIDPVSDFPLTICSKDFILH